MSKVKKKLEGKSKEEAEEFFRTKCSKYKGETECINDMGLRFNYGLFTPTEKKIVEESMNEYMEEHGFKLFDLQNYIINECPDFPRMPFLRHIAEKLKVRTCESIWMHLYVKYHPFNNKYFTPETDAQLLYLAKTIGFKWRKISKILEICENRCTLRYSKLSTKRKKINLESELLKGTIKIPNTEEGFQELSNRVEKNRAALIKSINKYLRGKLVYSFWNDNNSAKLLGYALYYNFFCSVDIDMDGLINFLDSNVNRVESLESLEKEKILEKIQFFAKNLNTCDLSVKLTIQDIFWNKIELKMGIDKKKLETQMSKICNHREIVTFNNLYGLFLETCHNAYINNVTDNLELEVQKVTGKSNDDK